MKNIILALITPPAFCASSRSNNRCKNGKKIHQKNSRTTEKNDFSIKMAYLSNNAYELEIK
ncbi:hypothetical protein Lste_1130 [Legionella steelei]|uniref:Uncharacterized protein n=1 Tax=Legionella steelei TaxID=947033 RepID=A0A0W0ZG81_9GAMM|nr:hypothetical protein [Legionella steelei]KTD67972.1 hypothetical protein Lste_1130 [Legionella steelei]